MTHSKRKLSIALASLATIAAISFGAREALAANPAATCMVNPPTELGECISEESCHQRCIAQPEATSGSFGDCNGPENCCACFL